VSSCGRPQLLLQPANCCYDLPEPVFLICVFSWCKHAQALAKFSLIFSSLISLAQLSLYAFS
jgi:hypothetical protein